MSEHTAFASLALIAERRVDGRTASRHDGVWSTQAPAKIYTLVGLEYKSAAAAKEVLVEGQKMGA